jgi:hypothetical protein
MTRGACFPRKQQQKSCKGEWLAGSLIDVGQIQVPYWTKWLLDQEIFW